MKSPPPIVSPNISRRKLLKEMGFAPLILRSAPLFGSSFLFAAPNHALKPQLAFPFADKRLLPHYPAQSPLTDVLKLVAPGSDDYVTEKYAFEIASALTRWSAGLKKSPRDHAALSSFVDDAIQASAFSRKGERAVRSSFGIDVVRREFASTPVTGLEPLRKAIDAWLGPIAQLDTAEFEIFGIEETGSAPLTVNVDLRYDLVAQRNDDKREERVGSWRMVWTRDGSGSWRCCAGRPAKRR